MPSTLLAIVEMFFQWVARQFENQGLLPSSPFTKALAYARNRRNGLEVFTRKFRHIPLAMKKTLTYDQGKEMARHEILAKRVKIDVYFADPHSPWQRPTNENTNGLVREYLPKGLDLAPISQGYLNAIARQLNNRPRKCLDLETPAEVFARKIMNFQPGVALQS
ncbi:IS30 family transposase [Dokdonella sp.]|jgi:IS30 family transposase|uniref:IS30 family transposase n=1 Tax=Dokdonella sp. TaxID=2291710 RepID=UPI002DD6411F|nr:IS30 family transposase [Dokdonella sp.]